jgi:GT2 family glycosyltransferase
MTVSVIVRSKDEADRLRLTLASLARQTLPAEVVVVDDGSADHTPAVLAEAAGWLPLRVIRHAAPRGRGGASNAGAEAASGDLLLFLDGDTLAGPELVARHAAAHKAGPGRLCRGETFHLRGTRFLQDPETGRPRPGEEARIARLPAGELDRLCVTLRQVTEDFAAIERRAEPGVYPGAGPRRLYELEMEALRHHPGCEVLWAASSGSNFSVETTAFRRVGGFHEGLDNNEHRELALRLCLAGGRMVAAEGARSYHLTHRVGWRDPLQDSAWEELFYQAHPIPAVKLLAVFWATLSDANRPPADMQIRSLPELEAAARGPRLADYEAARSRIRQPDAPATGTA